MKTFRCRLHTNQPITNFCASQQCLSQLCATCIAPHTNMHAMKRTLPRYENIQQTLAKAHQMVNTQINNIEAQKKSVLGFKEGWEKNKEVVHQKIKFVKQDVLQIVERSFVELQQKLYEKIEDVQMKMGMKNNEKIIKMLEAYNIQLQKYQSIQKKLQTVKGPSIVKKLYSEVLPKSKELANQILFDLSKLEAHDLDLLYQQNDLSEIKQKLLDLITVKVSFPSVPQPRQPLCSVVPVNQAPTISIVPASKTCSYFYSKPKPACKSLVSSTVLCVNGNSQIVVQTKSNISVIQGNKNQVINGSKHVLGGNMRKSHIFPSRPLSQLR